MLTLNRIVLVSIVLISFISGASASVTDPGIGDIYIDGKIGVTNAGEAYVLTEQQFNELPQYTIKTSTSWTINGRAVNFEGVRVRDILQLVKASGKTLRMHALNDYWVNIPVSDTTDFDIILARKMDGKPLEVRTFGPYFVIYPLDSNREKLNTPVYLSRFIWQVDKITVQ